MSVLLAGCDITRPTATPAAKRIGAFGAKVNAGSITEIRTALATQDYVRNTDGRFYLLPATTDTVIAVYWKVPGGRLHRAVAQPRTRWETGVPLLWRDV